MRKLRAKQPRLAHTLSRMVATPAEVEHLHEPTSQRCEHIDPVSEHTCRRNSCVKVGLQRFLSCRPRQILHKNRAAFHIVCLCLGIRHTRQQLACDLACLVSLPWLLGCCCSRCGHSLCTRRCFLALAGCYRWFCGCRPCRCCCCCCCCGTGGGTGNRRR